MQFWKFPLELNTTVLIGIAVGVIVVLIGLILVIRLFKGKAATPTNTESGLKLNVAQLSPSGPPQAKPYLEFYSVPVRLAVVVMAPVGRDGILPNDALLPQAMESILPGLMKVLTAHQPQFVRWPTQLSTQGFAHAFFNNVPLPGDHGRGTPWCSLAGKVEVAAGQFLVGFVCCSAEPNSLGEVTAKHAAGWPDVIRVKG